MTYERYQVIVVPFPFTDRSQSKRRPALILSQASGFGNVIGHSVMAMITSAKNAPWPLDVPIQDLEVAGLPAPSVVRMKLFTLDHRFVITAKGTLSPRDRAAVETALQTLLGQ